MDTGLVAETSILVNASPSRVWKILTTPEYVSKFLFGTIVTSDWKVGSEITYTGVWEGQPYNDKGIILRFEPEKIFQSTYWSSVGGTKDLPENYAIVTYALTKLGKHTKVTLTQDHNPDTAARDRVLLSWNVVLETIKKLAEH